MRLARILLGLARPYLARLWLVASIATLEALVFLAAPWLGGAFLGDLFADATVTWAVVLALLAVLGLHAALQAARAALLTRVSERLHADLRGRVFAHLLSLPAGWVETRRRGEVVSLLTQETEWVAGYMMGPLAGLLPLAVTAAGAVAIMLSLDPVLTFAVLLILPAGFVTARLVNRRITPTGDAIRAEHARSVARVEEALETLPAIKTAAREAQVIGEMRTALDRLRRLNIRFADTEAVAGAALGFGAAALVILVLWVAGARMLGDEGGAAELVAFLLYAALLTQPVRGLVEFLSETASVHGAAIEVDRLLAEPAEPDPGSRVPSGSERRIALDRLSFAYPGRGPLLDDIAFEIEPNQVVALTGANGAGKTTLLDLILRLRTPDAGAILLDGRPVTDYRLAEYRRLFGVVSQSAYLANTSVRDNILAGHPDAKDADLRRALETAGAAAFVDALPGGADTPIGDGGVLLSGGQRQRLALARALAGDPPILLLDEPTAMLDRRGTEEFAKAAAGAFAGRTVLMISHSDRVLSLADRVIRLADGAIVAELG